MPKKNYALLFLPFFLIGCRGASEEWIDFSGETPAIILAVGDSLTEGFGVEKTQNYPAKLQQKIDEKSLPFRVVNAGISGETSGELLARIDKVLRKWDPQIVILNIGANDALRAQDLAQTKQNIEQIIEKIGAEKLRPYFSRNENLEPRATRVRIRVCPNLCRTFHSRRSGRVYSVFSRRRGAEIVVKPPRSNAPKRCWLPKNRRQKYLARFGTDFAKISLQSGVKIAILKKINP